MSENDNDLKFKQIAQSFQNTKAEILKIYALLGANPDYVPCNEDGTFNRPESISDNLKLLHERDSRIADTVDQIAQAGIKAAQETVVLTQFIILFGMFLEQRKHLPPGSMKAMTSLFLKSLDEEDRTGGARIVAMLEAAAA